MPYSIYEQQQQLERRRVIFDENNPYGTTELRQNLPTAIQSIYNENTNPQQNQQQTQNGQLSASSQQQQSTNDLIMNNTSATILNGQSHNSNLNSNQLLDQLTLLNNTDTMNQLNTQNTLLNNSLQMSTSTGATTANHHNLSQHPTTTQLPPAFAPLLNATNNLQDPANIRWRDPDLHEVIEFLNHPNPIVKANAAAYLQHLSFMDDSIKQKARALGSINALINALNYELQLLNAQANQQQLTSANQLQTQPSRDVQRNCLGALRNLSFGRQNDENKRSIKSSNGIFALISLLKYSINDKELKELITGILWNLSSSEEIKTSIIDEAVKDIVNYIIIPGSGWDGRVNGAVDTSYDPVYGTGEIYWATVFRNSTGVLRNVSSAGEYARYFQLFF